MSPKLLIHCLVAWVALWSGPRPIFHNHEQLVHASPSSALLTQHLDQFHSGKTNSLPLGSHCHWLFVAEGILSSCDAGHRGQADIEIDSAEQLVDLLQAITVAQYLEVSQPTLDFSAREVSLQHRGYLTGRQLRQAHCAWTC